MLAWSPSAALAIPLVGLSQDAPTTTGWCFCVVEFKLFNGCDTCPEIMRISTIIHLGSEQQRPTQHIRRRPPSRCSCWPFAGVDRQRPQTQTNEQCQPTDNSTILLTHQPQLNPFLRLGLPVCACGSGLVLVTADKPITDPFA